MGSSLPATARATLDALPRAVFVLDGDGRIVHANAAARALGWGDRERGSLAERLGAEDAAHVLGLVEEVTARGESRLSRPVRCMEEAEPGALQLEPLELEGRFALCMPSDGAGDLRRAQLEKIFETTTVSLAYLDRDLAFVRVNETYARNSSMTPADLVGRKHFDLYPHEENEAIFRRVIETGEPYEVRAKPFEHPDQIDRGTTYWDWTLTPTRDANGEVDGALLALIDVTEHARAVHDHLALQRSFRAMLDRLPDGICVVTDERVSYANVALGRLVHLEPDALLGAPLDELLEGADHAALQRALALPSWPTEEPVECRLRSDDGAEVPTEAWATVVELDGTPSALHVFRDVRERRRLERQLRRTQKLESLGTLAGGVAHDINNLATVVLGETHFAARALPDGHPARERLKEIDVAMAHASRLTSQLLIFARRQSLAPEILRIDRVVDELAPLIRRVLGPGVELSLELAPTPTVSIDRSQLEQILMNLATNATQAMEGRGRVTLQTEGAELGAELRARLGQPRAARLRFKDDGPGMDEDTLAQLFDPFFTTREEGTGLGLATVYGAVVQSGGHIGVRSEPGRGTTFEIVFPEHAAVVADLDEERPWARARGEERVLLVEDDPAVRRATRTALRLHGYDVLDTGDLDGAVTIARSHPSEIDLLLADLMLGKRTGLEVAEEVQRIRPSIRVAFVSGYPAGVLEERGLAEASTALLTKPFTPEELGRFVRSVLDDEGP